VVVAARKIRRQWARRERRILESTAEAEVVVEEEEEEVVEEEEEEEEEVVEEEEEACLSIRCAYSMTLSSAAEERGWQACDAWCTVTSKRRERWRWCVPFMTF
jgi:hypothetical protein